MGETLVACFAFPLKDSTSLEGLVFARETAQEKKLLSNTQSGSAFLVE